MLFVSTPSYLYVFTYKFYIHVFVLPFNFTATWDNAFEKDAVSPSNIKNAVKELFERFAPGDDSKEKPDVNVTSRRLAKKMVAAHQSASLLY